MDDMQEPCPCCNGRGRVPIHLTDRQLKLLRALNELGTARSAELPDPGSAQRMAMHGLREKRLMTEQAYYGEYSRAPRYEYTITQRGKLLLEMKGGK